MNKYRFFFFSISFVRISFKPSYSKHDLDIKPTENEICKGLNRYFPKDARKKSEGGSVRSDLKKTTPSPPQFLHPQFSAQRAPEV